MPGQIPPLHQAALSGDINAMQAALLNGADASQKDALGNTALHLCAGMNNPGACQLLLDHHANVQAQNNEAMTPLHFSAIYNAREAAEFLLKMGADPHQKNFSGKSSAEISREKGHSNLLTLLAPPAIAPARTPSGMGFPSARGAAPKKSEPAPLAKAQKRGFFSLSLNIRGFIYAICFSLAGVFFLLSLTSEAWVKLKEMAVGFLLLPVGVSLFISFWFPPESNTRPSLLDSIFGIFSRKAHRFSTGLFLVGGGFLIYHGAQATVLEMALGEKRQAAWENCRNIAYAEQQVPPGSLPAYKKYSFDKIDGGEHMARVLVPDGEGQQLNFKCYMACDSGGQCDTRVSVVPLEDR